MDIISRIINYFFNMYICVYIIRNHNNNVMGLDANKP